MVVIGFDFIYNMPKVNTLTTTNAVGAATVMDCVVGQIKKLK